MGAFPQVGMEIKNDWNHHLEKKLLEIETKIAFAGSINQTFLGGCIDAVFPKVVRQSKILANA